MCLLSNVVLVCFRLSPHIVTRSLCFVLCVRLVFFVINVSPYTSLDLVHRKKKKLLFESANILVGNYQTAKVMRYNTRFYEWRSFVYICVSKAKGGSQEQL